MKRPNDHAADASLTRKRALIRSLIEQSRQANADYVQESAPEPVALFRVLGDEPEEPTSGNDRPLAEIIPFPVSERH